MLEKLKQQIEAKLDSLIPDTNPLYQGARYVLFLPGKRIRPLLTLLCSSENIEQALAPACALELVHTYSLIHDDLPCMDDDDFRRGKPTLHKVYDDAHAVLVGDYLLTYAFEILSKAEGLSDTQKLQLIQTLSLASGGEGMVGGQLLDIQNSPHFDQMHQQKTGALFRAACEFGGIVANASELEMKLLSQFGSLFGSLFQLVDDVLDRDHPEGEAKALEKLEKTHQQISTTLQCLPSDHAPLEEVIDLVMGQIPA